MNLRTLAPIAATAALLVASHGAVVVTGASMEPNISPGDVCLYRRTHAVEPGQVIVYERERGHGLVVHRAVTVGLRGEVRTRGDANEVSDPDPVAAQDVRGRVLLALPTGRFLRR